MKKSEHPWVMGKELCAAQLNVDVQLLTIASKHPMIKHLFKSNGRCCPSLIAPLLEQYKQELEDSAPEDIAYWHAMKKKWDALISQKTYEELEQKYVLREVVAQQVGGIAQAQKALLKSKLVIEYPIKQMGLTTPEIAALNETLVQEICDLMENLKV